MVIFKHVDFEVPDWGEFAQGPQSSGTGAVLERSVDAAFPDRPAADGWGLRVDLSAGTGASFLEYDLGVARPHLFVRLLFNPGTAAGGVVVLLQALDADGVETLRWSYSPNDRSITVTLATSQELIAVIPMGTGNQGPAWYCVELGIDADGGTAQLWLNGVMAASLTGSLTAINTQLLRIGAISKESGTSGDLFIDEFILVDDYIGPVLVTSASDFADAPARWLVVYNTDDPDSIAWVETYRVARGVPFGNLLGLSLSADEQIDSAAYSELRTDIQNYLTTNHLDDQIMGLLLGYHVPGYVDLAGDGELNPISALLCDLNNAPPRANPLATEGDPVRPTMTNLNGLRLTARIDGPDLASAQSLVSRSTAVMVGGLGDGGASSLWLNPYTSPDSSTDPVIASMINWAASVDRMRLNVPLELSASSDPGSEVQFPIIDDDGFFWGWAAATPPTGFFGSPAGSRLFSFPFHTAGSTAATLRSGTPSNWANAAIEAGYAAVAGASGGTSADDLPYIRPFFEALRLGWTIAEAWFAANPVPGQNLFLVGDPLLKIATPRGGWTIFGPVDRLEDLDPETSSLALPPFEQSAALPDNLQPAEGAAALYLLRRTDDQGHSEAGMTLVRTGNIAGVAVAPPLAPVWPDIDRWPVRITGGVARFLILWDRPLRVAQVGSVELQIRLSDGSGQTIQTPKLNPNSDRLELKLSLPEQSTQYRWRVVSAGSVILDTPWSVPIIAPSTPQIALQLLEVAP